MWANVPDTPLPAQTAADLLVVNKHERRLYAYSHGQLLRAYRVSLPKQYAGERRTPEGTYVMDHHNPASEYHRALPVSYPAAADDARERVQGGDPGGQIMARGIRNGLRSIGRAHRSGDWTAGCVAVTNSEIEELYRIAPDGTQIELRP